MKNIVIIGAGKGIGLAIASALHPENQVIAITKTPSEDLTKQGISTILLEAGKQNLQAGNDFPEAIHGLVYCPGSITLKPFHRLREEDFLNDFRQNVLGAVQCIQELLPRLKQGKASVVLFSSVAARVGMPFHASIACSKSGLEALAKSLAAEYASIPIRFNVIAPSLSDTSLAQNLLNTPEKQDSAAKRHPLQRIGTVQDSAALAQFLLSENSSWITGQVIGLDGGLGNLKV
ncbi:MAG: SDR family oxidoreductase [Bacteroidia bacterium]|nr:SDR family oxidoreductase [Bacteroidia bacterium]